MPDRLLHLEDKFPNLRPGNYAKTSEWDDTYNCVAFAGGDTSRKWDSSKLGYYWHPQAFDDDVYYALESQFALECGYVRCNDGSLEPGFEKVAIYADDDDNWTHAAHQLQSGEWESKCGDEEDIRHASPSDLEGVEYGYVKQYMKRPLGA